MSPEDATVPVIDVEEEYCRMGGCLNVAANISSLGAYLVTACSILTPFCKNELIKRGMGYGGILVPEELGLIKTRIIDKATSKQIVRADRNKVFSQKALEVYDRHSHTLYDLKHFEGVVISDYCKGIIDEKTILSLKTYKGPVFVDTKKPDLAIWNDVPKCLIKINEKEWNASSQKSTHPVIVTMGARGAQLRDCSDWHATVEFPIEAVSNPNSIGAGDTFLAGLVVKYVETGDIGLSVTYAIKAATESVKKFGTVEVKL
jgi:bifunctional ADP-heptose synthase (sugar kinase/adenylyltransferase)